MGRGLTKQGSDAKANTFTATKSDAYAGDLPGEQVRRLGFLYFTDAQDDRKTRLERVGSSARKALAVSCAERPMRRHEQLDPSERRPYTLAWRPVLDAIWQGLGTSSEDAMSRVSRALSDFHASPYDHNEGQDGPQDADEDAAAASIYAAECFVSDAPEFAFYSASRAVDAAFLRTDDELRLGNKDDECIRTPELDSLAREAMHPAVQTELRRQLADIEMLEQEGPTVAVLRRLKD